MATISFLSKEKQDVVIKDTSNGKYSNLNLNQKQQPAAFTFSELSKNLTNETKKLWDNGNLNAAVLFI